MKYRRMFFRLLGFCCIIFATFILVLKSSMHSNSNTKVSYTVDSAEKNPSLLLEYFSNRLMKNRTANASVVAEFKSLIHKLSKKCSNETWTLIGEQEKSILPPEILQHPVLKRFLDRLCVVEKNCRSDSRELHGLMSQDPDEKIIQDQPHLLSICLNAKAASSSFMMYSKALEIYSVMDDLVDELKKETTKELLKPRSPSVVQGLKRRFPEGNLKAVVVRHPFQRIVSSYVDKMFHRRSYRQYMLPEIFDTMLNLSTLTPKEAKDFIFNQPNWRAEETAIVHLKCPQFLESAATFSSSTSLNKFGELIPSFRGYVLGTLQQLLPCKGDPKCLNSVDRHYRNQVPKCAPCQVKYDAIVKVETLKEDVKFIEDLLGLDSAWWFQEEIYQVRMSLKHRSVPHPNFREKPFSYSEYLKELTQDELSMLYSAHYQDFRVFGYDPCDGLEPSA